MLKNIITTCKALEKNWNRESFPAAARLCLESLSFESSLEDFEVQVAEWLEHNKLPKQLNLYNNFGEPSLTLFNNGEFAIDIYFWRKNDTLIHSHGFRGAFKVLYGLSLHEDFEVKTKHKFTEDVLESEIKSKEIRVMKSGDVQQINPDMELTHRVVHLEDPTVTLCVRTVDDLELNQWHHLSTGLSFQKKHISQKTIKKSLYCQYLLRSDKRKAVDLFFKNLRALETAEQISLYEGVCFDQIGFDAESTEFFSELMYEYFQKTEWFELYQAHYENSQTYLQESEFGGAASKLVAHAINKDFQRSKTESLLQTFTDEKVSKICDDLKSQPAVFVEGFEADQLERIDSFKNGG